MFLDPLDPLNLVVCFFSASMRVLTLLVFFEGSGVLADLSVFSLFGVFEAFLYFNRFGILCLLDPLGPLDWVFCFLSAFVRVLTLSWELLLCILEKLLSTFAI